MDSQKIEALSKTTQEDRMAMLRGLNVEELSKFLIHHREFCKEYHIHPFEITKALDGEKQKLLAEQARASTNTQISRIEFHKLNFDEKKIIVRNFIHAVLLRDDQVKILWKF